MNILDSLQLPEFKNYTQTPHNSTCLAIDTTRLMVEILGGNQYSQSEFNKSEHNQKILLDGQYALVIRYKREKDDTYYPSVTLSFNTDENDNIILNQLQGSKERNVAYRFYSSFKTVNYYLKLIEESFSKKGIYVCTKKLTEIYYDDSISNSAYSNYRDLSHGVDRLNNIYGVKKRD